ncbi:hypothetical protein C4D60_Mb08t09650 [Musa balbisiana]|uniref:Uncharacterized protein n=1 Tax=Musa balbisiana TaxID=52838 RepID=A0A4S8K2K0_MUSBA|nr:hypothetical protein C4D60_Mb08t09650 [Musa balbisiana]
MVLNSIGALEHDHVDAGELLEERNEDGYGELRPILAFQYVAPWILDRLRLLVGCHEVLVLRIDVISATDLLQHDLSLLIMPTIDERVGGCQEGAMSLATGTAASTKLTHQPHPSLILAVA